MHPNEQDVLIIYKLILFTHVKTELVAARNITRIHGHWYKLF